MLYTASELATVKTAPAWVSIVRAFNPEGAELLDSFLKDLRTPSNGIAKKRTECNHSRVRPDYLAAVAASLSQEQIAP